MYRSHIHNPLRRALCADALPLLVALVLTGGATAAPLSWDTAALNGIGSDECLALAEQEMQAMAFQNLKRDAREVSGLIDASSATIACIGDGPDSTAVIMVVGDEAKENTKVKDNLGKQLGKHKRPR